MWKTGTMRNEECRAFPDILVKSEIKDLRLARACPYYYYS